MNEFRLEFHEALDALRTDVVLLGQMTTEMIGRGTAAFLQKDLGAMRNVVDSDDAVDLLALDVEERCYSLLARQNPMAGDLRLIICSLRLAMELERCADLAVNVCKGARRIFDVELDARMRGLIETMSNEAARMVRRATEAYYDSNEGLAAALDDFDDRLDALQTETVQWIFEASRAGQIEIREAVQLAMMCRFYERIGDHAVNMGERVVYLVSGWLPEHGAAARAALRERSASSDPSADPGIDHGVDSGAGSGAETSTDAQPRPSTDEPAVVADESEGDEE
jgi:phosphate transport system protein